LDSIFKVLTNYFFFHLTTKPLVFSFKTHFSRTRSGHLKCYSNLNRRNFSKLQTEIQNKRKGKQKKNKIKEEARSPTGPHPGDQPAQIAPSRPNPTFPLSLSPTARTHLSSPPSITPLSSLPVTLAGDYSSALLAP
jgi:hypothetical protein